jgi:isopentenyl-diphosphate delta-isomerase
VRREGCVARRIPESAIIRAMNTVSADPDELILVDEADRSLGLMSKARCHEGRGLLHRAFSLLIFNESGELLIQQRAASKRLWPMYWSNSCCSHPRGDETLETATTRRLLEELGIRCPLHFLYKFQYQAQFDATGAENELCSVYAGRCREPVRANPTEIRDWRWIGPEALNREMAAQGGRTFTPWFLLEWARIWRDHRSTVLVI